MKEFMVFIFRDDMPTTGIRQGQKDVRTLLTWIEKLSRSGNFISGDLLGNDVLASHSIEFIDGSSMQSPVNACVRIAALNMEQAMEIANECPLNFERTIQVRPITIFEL
jgi:hypothetical protein